MKINISHFTVYALLLLSIACKKDPLNEAEVVKFENPEAENVAADNHTTITLTAIVPKDSDPLTPVVFTTDVGTFEVSKLANITVNADKEGKAVAKLKSNVTGIATVKATVGTKYVAAKTVNFILPEADKIFTVPAFTDNALADGKSTIEITALVNKDLPASDKAIVFTADNGATFSNGTSANGTASTTITADGTGKATAYLKSSTVGPVHVSLALGNITRNYVVNFIKADPDNIFTVPAFTTSAPADGISTIELTALVNKSLPASSQSVVFTADNGATFVSATGGGTATIVADASGKATTLLKSTVAGPVNISITAGGISRYYVVNFLSPDPDNVFVITSYTDHVSADGASTAKIVATVNKNLKGSKTVTFAADNSASFSTGSSPVSLTPDASGVVTAYLKSSTIGESHVAISCGGITRNIVINFDRAFPDMMFLTSGGSLSSGVGNTLPITITLSKNVGTPSGGFLFNYSAVDKNGNNVGFFSNQTASSSTGTATVSYSGGTSTYKGIVTITVSLQQNPTIKVSSNIAIN